MPLVVMKFGGTSVGSIERIQNVARRALAAQTAGDRVIIVSSAMSGETNRLIGLATEITKLPDPREMDQLVSTGETVACGLLAIAIQNLGGKARSYTGPQVPIRTGSDFMKARITAIEPERLLRDVAAGVIPVVTGFQGIDAEGNVTTLGRGGSDLSAVAVAAAVKADRCDIYTDVDGVYTTDPNMCPSARKLGRITHEEMLEAASLGAKVLQTRSVEFAMKWKVPVQVRSSLSDAPGTMIVEETKDMEGLIATNVAYDKNEAKVTVQKVPDKPGIAARIFKAIGDANINVDMIVQNVSADGTTDLTFTVTKAELERTRTIIEPLAKELGAAGVQTDSAIAKVSVVGLGMRSYAGVASRMFQALARESINVLMISTSEIRISVVISEKYTELAVRTLHDEFKLGENPA
ncbi:MAG: aspartate kinase [Deltaproteobacteria bacterium]|nr:aspartate kinase [Deltaproteobacteria bacterium]